MALFESWNKNDVQNHVHITRQQIMEAVLWLYAPPNDDHFPVVCFDERSCFLIAEAVEPEPLSLQSGNVRKEHYSFEKNGTCSLLSGIEPLSGKPLARV